VEDLGQLIFVVLFILFGLISSSKKKARTQEGSATEAELLPPQEVSSDAETTVRPKRELAEELLTFLQSQATPEPEPEPVAVVPEVDDEARSLETYEPAGEESHERFREKYVDVVPEESPYEVDESPADRPYAVTDTPVERPYLVEDATSPRPYAVTETHKDKRRLTRSELRHAFVMKEVLGPPKALE